MQCCGKGAPPAPSGRDWRLNGQGMSGQELYWDSAYEIILALMEAYPNADLDDMGLEELNQRITALPGFADDPALANDAILKEILRDWYEESEA